ncbi:MAG TPA: hypothetical protein VFJ58_30135 [Armatimonadota bacterium]|nr:hypothetical protein [Armatimonadota bacterium]
MNRTEGDKSGISLEQQRRSEAASENRDYLASEAAIRRGGTGDEST